MVNNKMSFDEKSIDEYNREVIMAFLKIKYRIE